MSENTQLKPFTGKKLAWFASRLTLPEPTMEFLQSTGFEVLCLGTSEAYDTLQSLLPAVRSFFRFRLLTEPDCDLSYRETYDFSPDYLMTFHYHKKLPQRFVDCAKQLAFNVHPSLLPKFKGAHPYTLPLEAGDAQSGVSVHKLTQQYDYGDILYQLTLDVPAMETEFSILKGGDSHLLSCLRGFMGSLANNTLLSLPNPEHPQKALARRVKDSWLDFSKTGIEIERLIRARNCTNGLLVGIGGQRYFRIIEASLYQGDLAQLIPSPAGVLQITENFALLYCQDGVLEVTVVMHSRYGLMSMRRFAIIEKYKVNRCIILTPMTKNGAFSKKGDEIAK